ncbi:Dihydrolipoamide acetyltransferase component of pyruvate dehydrogenase complex [Abortiporus biennis]
MLRVRYLRKLGRPGLYYPTSHFHTSFARWAKVNKTFKLADIGEGITECEVIRWSIKPQAAIQAFDALCEVQSDKASVEITSPYDGTITELLVKEGEVAKVGEGLCIIEVDEEAAADDETSASPPPHPEQEETSSPIPPSQAEVVSPQASSTPAKRRPHPLDPNASSEEISAFGNQENVLATPSVRHLARQNGVDLSKLVPGSGKAGRIEKKDVEAYLVRPQTTSSSVANLNGERPAVGEDVVVELGRTRYSMWKAMTKSLEIPHFGYSTSLDLTEFHNILPTLNHHIPLHYRPSHIPDHHPSSISPSSFYAQPTPEVSSSYHFHRLTYLPVLLKTLSRAMLEWPLFRSSITPAAENGKPTLTLRPNADISIALSTPSGLYTPTIQGVNNHSIYSLASQLSHLSHLGRQTPSGLTPAELPKRGGTVTVSNIGGIGQGEGASPVLVPGAGIAIVAVGRAQWIWDVNRGDGSGERRLKVSVGWSADHRVVEGAELVAFIETWRSWVEHPQRLIGEGI